jgi:uncharacterized protein YndB with AHSA1/START domain
MTIVIFLVLVVVGILVFASTKPDIVTFQHATNIKASPEKIFPLINDFHNWPSWAPQDGSDATMKRSFGEVMSGKGASSEWASKGRAGSGRMEITESTPPLKITVKVDFTKPFKAHNINEFTLEPKLIETKVTWKMHGTNPYMAKVMSVFVSMDKIMGKHFETGLRSLTTLAEK